MSLKRLRRRDAGFLLAQRVRPSRASPFKAAMAAAAAVAAAVVALVLVLGLGLGVAVRLTPLPRFWRNDYAGGGPPTLVRVLDRDGGELARARAQGAAFIPVRLSEVDPLLIRATLAAEDRRFFIHPGCDPLSLLRAARQNAVARRRVSGGSTLTQQAVKLLRCAEAGGRPGPRSLAVKAREAFWALVVEAHCEKEAILERYVNLAGYGSNVQGVEAAARTYFGHGAQSLVLEEAALLAALPRSPVGCDPRRDPEAARRARDRVLARMDLAEEERAAALERPIRLAPALAADPTEGAPHWIAHTLRRHPGAVEVRLPIDTGIQGAATAALRRTLLELRDRGADAGAVVVLHNPSGEVRAWVGSADWRDPSHGQFDAAWAHRQPGSTLKPFTYALAFEDGLRPATVLPDLPLEYAGADGAFRPRNYSGEYHGPVRASVALANSWNAPAVAVLSRLGPERLLERLRAAGLCALRGSAKEYGLGLTLGDGDVPLMELATAYACLARGGVSQPRVEVLSVRDAGGRAMLGRDGADGDPRDAREGEQPGPEASRQETDPRGTSRRVLDPAAAFFVQSILSDSRARRRAFGEEGPFALPFEAAWKTGTSSDWRDSWAFAFTPEWTAGAWVGCAEGAPMERVSGRNGATLVVQAVLRYLGDERGAAAGSPFPVPAGVERRTVCALSGEAPYEACPERVEEWFRSADPALPECRWHVVVALDAATGEAPESSGPRERVLRAIRVVPPEESPADRYSWPGEVYAAWGRAHGWEMPPAERTPRVRRGFGFPDDAALEGERSLAHARAGAVALSDGASESRRRRLRILRPADGAVYALDPSLPASQQEVTLAASGADGTVSWFVDGRLLRRARPGEAVSWRIVPGWHTIRAIDSGDGAPYDAGSGFEDRPAAPSMSEGRIRTGGWTGRPSEGHAEGAAEIDAITPVADPAVRGRSRAAEVSILVEPGS